MINFYNRLNDRGTKDGFVFHDTRHCFNINMRKSRVPESIIIKITGHSTREMFLRYYTVDSLDIGKAVDQGAKNEKGVNR